MADEKADFDWLFQKINLPLLYYLFNFTILFNFLLFIGIIITEHLFRSFPSLVLLSIVS